MIWRYLRSNWLSLVTLAVAALALYVAFQANEIAQEANQISIESNRIAIKQVLPDVEILPDPQVRSQIVYPAVCKMSFNEDSPYRLNRSAHLGVILANHGGRNVSLVEVAFTEGDREYGLVSAKEGIGARSIAELAVELPGDIEPGTARQWSFVMHANENVATGAAILDSIGYVLDSRTMPEIQIPAVWTFTFSDGTTLQRTFSEGWYSFPSWIDKTFEEACS